MVCTYPQNMKDFKPEDTLLRRTNSLPPHSKSSQVAEKPRASLKTKDIQLVFSATTNDLKEVFCTTKQKFRMKKGSLQC